jgi:hypothetical protein
VRYSYSEPEKRKEMNILIRDVDKKTAEKLDELARQKKQTRQQFLADLLNEITDSEYDPDVVLGYIELKNGELDKETSCPGCGQDLENPFIGFDGALRPFGPVCWRCAE